jgi:DNA repair exonuclease SbcCD ATPase subunit
VIPQRVKLSGFLCYKDEQEVGFDGASLWMLSGLNGSGKSTVFDAVTYALFGHHRGGKTEAHELINKDSDKLVVEFDFTLDRQLYRVKRTLRRNTRGGASGTQQVLRFQAGDGVGGWEAVEGTGLKREFDVWVEENIGLNYETFTSSVLLLQGKAEKLLNSGPADRRAVLAGIVDLERYEKLHDQADKQRKALGAVVESLANRLEALPAVQPLELEASKNRIAQAEDARARARAEVERLQRLGYRADEWLKGEARLAEARRRWQTAQGLLQDAVAIEKAVERLRELKEVLPSLQELIKLRAEVHKSEGQTKELTRQREKLVEQRTQRDHALTQARAKQESLRGMIARDQDRQREVSSQLPRSTLRVERLKECERQEVELARVREELARLPADPTRAVAAARSAFEVLGVIHQTVPQLTRFQAQREELGDALAREHARRQALDKVEKDGLQLKADQEKLRPLLDTAAAGLQEASDAVAQTRTLLQQARASLKEVTELEGAQRCRHCGQELTPGHIVEEKRRRNAEVVEAERRARTAADAHRRAKEEEAKLREQVAQLDRSRQDLRVEYSTLKKEVEQAQTEAARLQRECGQVYAELPEPYRGRISPAPPADWRTTAYPTADDLNTLRNEASGMTAARQALQQAERGQQQWASLKTQEASARQNLERVQADLPDDRDGIRKEHADLLAEDQTLDKNLKALRGRFKEAEQELDRLAKAREEAHAQVVNCEGALKNEELVRKHAQENAAKIQKTLPASWLPLCARAGMRELGDWTRERTDLEQARTEERGRELQQARVNLDVLRQDVEAQEAHQATFPEEARRDPAEIAKQLAEANLADRVCDEELGDARKQLALLETYQKQRKALDAEYREKAEELKHQDLLARLLGKDRLQLYLVRQAERQVVDHANAVLDRLSGGQLYLKLSGEANGEGSNAKALELESYNRATGEKPINVAFLSGSQKFRVAVSLALGIGQYASRQHRPIESVIIDEGFGCLDRQGRHVMIQELQNLRDQMRCILLVSHQEEFADAFPNIYHFELEDGATRVKRFQK